MKLISNLFTFSISFLWSVKCASSVLCYDCNSAFDPRCGEGFDHFSLGVVNCSLKDPLDHIAPVESTFCRIIKMEIFGKLRVVRKCGYLKDEFKMNGCKKQTGTGELFVTYCSCNTDLCNNAPRSQEMALFSAVTLFGIVNIIRNCI
ncbi:uncharacterized protein LOC123715998 [Pieris brassicae]|uniref:uncharacterized protein LOC123715998 n=1 Tax=Pieris brassicae TaxID=7116 RepID=UPI001E661AA7|nr:uncharacterized protein LOC123715998 [Pieris brassicae]